MIARPLKWGYTAKKQRGNVVRFFWLQNSPLHLAVHRSASFAVQQMFVKVFHRFKQHATGEGFVPVSFFPSLDYFCHELF